MKRKILLIIAIFLILAGIMLICFPIISNLIYNKKIEKMRADFIDGISEYDDKLEKLYQKLLAENQDLYENKQKNLVDPFSYEQPTIDLSEYGIEDNIIGYIDIPKIDIVLPIYLGANTENMKKGAVHLTQTSYPIGGINTNSVIAAHRGWSGSKMFRNIDKLEIGDKVYIQNFREELIYTVCKIEIIEPDEINKLLIQEGEDMVTLITCHPYRVNTHRYVVYCERFL